MKSEHLALLESVFRKFVVLTHEQVFFLLQKRLKRRGIYYCIEQLISENRIVPEIGLLRGKRLYIATRQALSVVPDQGLSTNQSQSSWHIAHRLGCGQVAFALASRSLVTGIALEHEFARVKLQSPIIERRPDGLIRVERPGRPAMTVAIEVEIAQKARDRIRQVVESYTSTFDLYPNRVAGVIVVCAHPRVAEVYREELERTPKKFPNRFVISESLALSDVQESILGRALAHPTDNPSQPLQSLCTECNDGCLNFDLTVSTRIQGTHSGFESGQQMTGEVL